MSDIVALFPVDSLTENTRGPWNTLPSKLRRSSGVSPLATHHTPGHRRRPLKHPFIHPSLGKETAAGMENGHVQRTRDMFFTRGFPIRLVLSCITPSCDGCRTLHREATTGSKSSRSEARSPMRFRSNDGRFLCPSARSKVLYVHTSSVGCAKEDDEDIEMLRTTQCTPRRSESSFGARTVL